MLCYLKNILQQNLLMIGCGINTQNIAQYFAFGNTNIFMEFLIVILCHYKHENSKSLHVT